MKETLLHPAKQVLPAEQMFRAEQVHPAKQVFPAEHEMRPAPNLHYRFQGELLPAFQGRKAKLHGRVEVLKTRRFRNSLKG